MAFWAKWEFVNEAPNYKLIGRTAWRLTLLPQPPDYLCIRTTRARKCMASTSAPDTRANPSSSAPRR